MSPRDGAAPDAYGPIDDIDLAVLDEVADLYDTIDPVPPGLVARIQFGLALEDSDVALMELLDDAALATGARGERSQTRTFRGPELSMTIRVVGLSDDAVRVDGWLAPPAGHSVVLKSGHTLVERTADEDGRFVFEHVPPGPARLFVRVAGADRSTADALATPTVVL